MNQKNKTKCILIGIVVIGIILRIICAVRFEIDFFQIDLGIADSFDENYTDEFYDGIVNFNRDYLAYGGHLEYIFTIYNTGNLPDTNANQCYHPPLSQAMYAGFMKIESLFTDNNRFLVESLEFLSIIYSVLIILVSYKILKEIGFEDKDTIIPIAIITFHPTFIFLSRLVNTDGLLSLLILVSVLYLIKWYKNPSYKNVFILALAVGFSTMTKTSGVVMALPLFVIFMKKLKNSVDDTKVVVNILIQAVLFSLITLPMTFWYPIRNYLKFGQGLFGIAEALQELRVADNSFFARWMIGPEFLNAIYEMNASNVWSNLIISSINFAMNSYAVPYTLSMSTRITSVVLIVISIISIIMFSNKGENKDLKFILLITYISWVIGYIYFNISLPYSCTIHARYIITAIAIGSFYVGIFYKNIKNKNLKYTIIGITSLFVMLSIILFIFVLATKGNVTITVIL